MSYNKSFQSVHNVNNSSNFMMRMNPSPSIEFEQTTKMFDSLIADYNRLKILTKPSQPNTPMQISNDAKQSVATLIDKIQQIFLLFHNNNAKCETKIFYEDDTFLMKNNEV